VIKFTAREKDTPRRIKEKKKTRTKVEIKNRGGRYSPSTETKMDGGGKTKSAREKSTTQKKDRVEKEG